MLSKTVTDNYDYIKESLENGIDSDTVNLVVNDLLDKSDTIGRTPKQVKKAIDAVVSMKSDENKIDTSRLSNYVKENSVKIYSALNSGLSSEDIARKLMSSLENSSDKKGMEELRFVTQLVSKMKEKELKLKLQKENEKGVSYVKKN